MKRCKFPIVIISGCFFLLTACGNVQTGTQPETWTTYPSTVSTPAVSGRQENAPVQTPDPSATTELPLQKTEHTIKETKLIVPGYSTCFYVKNNARVIADDPHSIDTDQPATSFILSGSKWEKKKTPFDTARKNGKITSVSSVTQRPNGDYIFINGTNEIVRMSETGRIKYRVNSGQLFSKKRLLASMIYLGEGKAILQSQDDFFDTHIYARQDNSILHLDYVDLKNGKTEISYPDGWRLCGATDKDSLFAEKEKKIAKIKTATGEFVRKYSTEAIWSEGSQDTTTDEEENFFHNYAITWSAFDGKLYAKHVGGIFLLDEDTLCWKQLISSKDDFTMGPMYNNTFALLDKNKALLMAYRCDDESATDCCLYEWE